MKAASVVALSKKRTNGRLLKALLRGEFRLLGRFAPRLSDKRAAALFSTPRRRRARLQPGTAGLVAMPFTVASGPFKLAAWRWGEGPTVLLAHGWNGSAAQLSSFIRPLVDAGFRVVAFDQPAHGRSSGRRTTLVQMTEALHSVAREVGPLHAVVAHSLGATATALALFDNLPAGRVVLVAPPAAPPYFARRLAEMLSLSAARTAGMLAELERSVGIHLEALDVRRIAGWLRQPALLFHDGSDREVPFAHGQSIAEAWPKARFIPLERLGHIRPLSDVGVARTTVAFLREGFAATAVHQSGAATSA